MTALSIWRVETLRLVRTRRLLVLVAVYIFMGAAGPLSAKYAQQIFAHVSNVSNVSSVRITVVKPTPVDGILGFYRSAMQLGAVACITVTGLAVAIDAHPQLSVFYRTRTSVATALLPRLTLTMLAAELTYSLGYLFACYETTVLLGAPDLGRTVQTWGLGLCFTAFSVALGYLASAFFRSVIGTVGTAIGVVMTLPVAGTLGALRPYLPSRLTTLPAELFTGASHPSAVPAVLVALGLSMFAMTLAPLLIARRQAC